MGDGNKARRRRREGGRVSGQRSPSVWDPGCGRSCSGEAARDTAELEGGVQRGPVGSNLQLDVKLGIPTPCLVSGPETVDTAGEAAGGTSQQAWWHGERRATKLGRVLRL